MGISVFVLGIVIGAFVVPGIVTDPQTAFNSGKDVIGNVAQIMEIIIGHV